MNEITNIVEKPTLLKQDIELSKLIYTIRGKQIMLDCDLAILYGYTVKRLNEQVKNIAIYTIKGQADKTYFENISRKSVVTYNAVRCDWAAAGVINFYTKRNLETVNLTKDLLTEYLEQENENGYGIVDNTLVIECYMY
mgnify:CR=1 FL=1